MPIQMNSFQKKEQGEVLARELIKIDICNKPELEFKTTIVRRLAMLEKSIEETKETLMQR